MMAILNYTTKIGSEQTVSQIEKILVRHGARAFLKECDEDGFVSALAFKAKTPHGELGFRLPVDADATFRVMQKQRVEGKIPMHYVNEAQARRTAWRIVKDWVEAQMAILETEMVHLEQIFLPYVVTKTGETIYERMVGARFLLEEGQE